MKKVVLLVGLLMCGGAWADIPNNSIESNLKQCISEDESPSGGGIRNCQKTAIDDYERVLKNSKTLKNDLLQQYIAVSKACKQPYASRDYSTSSVEDSRILSCQLDVARHFMEVGKFLQDNKE